MSINSTSPSWFLLFNLLLRTMKPRLTFMSIFLVCWLYYRSVDIKQYISLLLPVIMPNIPFVHISSRSKVCSFLSSSFTSQNHQHCPSLPCPLLWTLMCSPWPPWVCSLSYRAILLWCVPGGWLSLLLRIKWLLHFNSMLFSLPLCLVLLKFIWILHWLPRNMPSLRSLWWNFTFLRSKSLWSPIKYFKNKKKSTNVDSLCYSIWWYFYSLYHHCSILVSSPHHRGIRYSLSGPLRWIWTRPISFPRPSSKSGSCNYSIIMILICLSPLVSTTSLTLSRSLWTALSLVLFATVSSIQAQTSCQTQSASNALVSSIDIACTSGSSLLEVIPAHFVDSTWSSRLWNNKGTTVICCPSWHFYNYSCFCFLVVVFCFMIIHASILLLR